MPLWAWVCLIWIAAIIVFCWFWSGLMRLKKQRQQWENEYWEDDYDK